MATAHEILDLPDQGLKLWPQITWFWAGLKAVSLWNHCCFGLWQVWRSEEDLSSSLLVKYSQFFHPCLIRPGLNSPGPCGPLLFHLHFICPGQNPFKVSLPLALMISQGPKSRSVSFQSLLNHTSLFSCQLITHSSWHFQANNATPRCHWPTLWAHILVLKWNTHPHESWKECWSQTAFFPKHGTRLVVQSAQAAFAKASL